MWPLIFAREEPVRRAVLDSWYQLYLHQRNPQQQVGCDVVALRMQWTQSLPWSAHLPTL